jgi:succinate-semialdehyde dehydrogenase / glutarate-semialdehyde dehydrogenase
MKSINPATGEIIRHYENYSHDKCDQIVDQVYEAWQKWKNESFQQRSRAMHQAADLLIKNRETYARLITTEMGKVIREAISEVEKSAWVCRFYAEHAAQFLADEPVVTDASKSFVTFQPLGPVLAIMPWNFPFWQVFRFAAPALMAGNAGVLKHAYNVPGCALAIEEIFESAGFHKNIFRTLLVGSANIGRIIENPKIAAATLTGSEYAGSETAALCGKKLKKTVLELGGSDAFVVLNDADLKNAAFNAVNGRMINNGQSCIAAKRFIVEKGVYNDFVDLVVEHFKKLKTGNPLLPETDFGPMAREDLMEDLKEQINKSADMGAEVIFGGQHLDMNGFYFQPAIVINVTADMALFNEETFGPVMPVIKAEDEQHAIYLANLSKYGLGGSIWTSDVSKGERLAREIESGAVFVNEITKSDPRLPFGGIKLSGYGRELSHYGIKEFTNIKSVWIK